MIKLILIVAIIQAVLLSIMLMAIFAILTYIEEKEKQFEKELLEKIQREREKKRLEELRQENAREKAKEIQEERIKAEREKRISEERNKFKTIYSQPTSAQDSYSQTASTTQSTYEQPSAETYNPNYETYQKPYIEGKPYNTKYNKYGQYTTGYDPYNPYNPDYNPYNPYNPINEGRPENPLVPPASKPGGSLGLGTWGNRGEKFSGTERYQDPFYRFTRQNKYTKKQNIRLRQLYGNLYA